MEENKNEEPWVEAPAQGSRPTHGFTSGGVISVATALAESSRIQEQQAAAAAAQQASEKKGWFGRRK